MRSPLPPFFIVYAVTVLTVIVAFTPLMWLLNWDTSYKVALFTATLIICLMILKKGLTRLSTSLESLKVGLLNFKDGEFSNQLVYCDKDPLGDYACCITSRQKNYARKSAGGISAN